MTRFFFLLSLMFLFTACTEPPQPCTGDACPKPVVCEANPAVVKPSVTPGLSVTSTFKSCYKRGAADSVDFNLQVDPAKIKIPFEQAQFVVDIVTEDSNKKTESVLDEFFSSENDFSVSPENIFQPGTTKSKAELVTGLSAKINFKFKGSAPVGNPFYFVVSLFKSPGSTSKSTDLIGRIIYKFKTAEQ